MYHFFFLLLLFFSLLEFLGWKNKLIFKLISFLLLLFVAFKYGQGSDYFSYVELINRLANLIETGINSSTYVSLNQEIGFSYLCYFWIKVVNLSAELLISLLSAVSFYFIILFIKKYSSLPVISLFIFYCTFYLIYPFSILRQSICISIFVLYLIPLLFEKKYFKYFLFSTLLVLIHSSAAILFILPIVHRLKLNKYSTIVIISLISLLLGLIMNRFFYSYFEIIDFLANKAEHYERTTTIDILALLLRIFIFVPIIILSKYYQKNSIKELFLKIYILGFFLYLVFISSSLISSRLNVYMRYFEMILLADSCIYLFKRYGKSVLLNYSYIIIIMTVLYVKNINSFIVQGPYYDFVNFYNYPYVSIFNKKKIIETRYIPPYFQEFVKNE